jgi:tRNA(adenine34) deaminase
MFSHEDGMRLALAEAEYAASLGEVPIGCVITDDDGFVWGRGHNLRESRRDPTAHAEMFAIEQASWARQNFRLDGLTAYVTLEPCPMCAGALVLGRVARVVYGCADAKAGAIDSLFNIGKTPHLNHQFEVVSGVLADTSAAKLRAFFASLRAQGKNGRRGDRKGDTG